MSAITLWVLLHPCNHVHLKSTYVRWRFFFDRKLTCLRPFFWHLCQIVSCVFTLVRKSGVVCAEPMPMLLSTLGIHAYVPCLHTDETYLIKSLGMLNSMKGMYIVVDRGGGSWYVDACDGIGICGYGDCGGVDCALAVGRSLATRAILLPAL